MAWIIFSQLFTTHYGEYFVIRRLVLLLKWRKFSNWIDNSFITRQFVFLNESLLITTARSESQLFLVANWNSSFIFASRQVRVVLTATAILAGQRVAMPSRRIIHLLTTEQMRPAAPRWEMNAELLAVAAAAAIRVWTRVSATLAAAPAARVAVRGTSVPVGRRSRYYGNPWTSSNPWPWWRKRAAAAAALPPARSHLRYCLRLLFLLLLQLQLLASARAPFRRPSSVQPCRLANRWQLEADPPVMRQPLRRIRRPPFKLNPNKSQRIDGRLQRITRPPPQCLIRRPPLQLTLPGPEEKC